MLRQEDWKWVVNLKMARLGRRVLSDGPGPGGAGAAACGASKCGRATGDLGRDMVGLLHGGWQRRWDSGCPEFLQLRVWAPGDGRYLP